jgi:hypothetical protein
MRPTLSAALSFALIAAPVSAASPCDALAEAINSRFAAGTLAREVGRELVLGEIPGARLSRPSPGSVTVGDFRYEAGQGARIGDVPHAPGVRFVELRDGTARCQVFDLYRRVEGKVRALSNAGIGQDESAFCGLSAARPLGIGGKPYVAQVLGFGPDLTLHPVTARGMAAPVCALAFETRFDGRIDALEPNDAAAVQARRAAMAVLEPALPAIADSFYRAERRIPLPGARLLNAEPGSLAVEFAAAEGRYIARVSGEGDEGTRFAARLARVFPELGGRERALASFVYAGDRRFVRALSRHAELR